MKISELACGDIVVVNEFGNVYEAIIIAHGTNNQPLIIKTDELKCDIYRPQWTTYEHIIDAPHYVNIKKAILKEYKKIN